MKKKLNLLPFVLLLAFISCSAPGDQKENRKQRIIFPITEVNSDEIPIGKSTIAFVGVSLIDGIGESSIKNASVIVSNGIITGIGETGILQIPEGAEKVNGEGLTLMPGLIDAHYHNAKNFPTIYLKRGVTSLRDPGIWIEDYDSQRQNGDPLPRLFLTGPHLDMPPPTWPKDCYVVRDKAEVKAAMDFLIGQGSTAIKIYHRLSLGLIEEVCKIAHKHGLPVTAHLEITDARQAILAGLDGVEHVTSLGTALISRKKAEVYRQRIMANSEERKPGRYEMWKDIDVNSKAADSLINFLVEHQTFLTPTLGTFEYRLEPEKHDSTAAEGFTNMMAFIGRCAKANVRIVVGSHGPWSKYNKRGWTYQYEMELLAKTGMENMEIIKAATIENARFFKVDHRLGSVEKGKQADLILVEGDPVADIKAMYNVKRVMLNGAWVE